MRHLDQFLAAEPRVGIVTVHRYPLQRCFVTPASPAYPTIAHLLDPAASRGLAAGVAPYAALAHARGARLRVDEMNSVACGGARGVSDTFASALWALDSLFAMARAGVDGVNIHTFPGARYAPFSFSRAGGSWQAFVAPEYYGLLLFAQAAPAGSRLLAIANPAAGRIRAWATRAPDGRIRVVLINNSSRARIVGVRIPAATGTATLERLQAPRLDASGGVTLGRQGFGPRTRTGLLPGSPQTATVPPSKAGYVIRLPAASAAMLTLG
jgi:hypothetical protein